MLPLLAPCLPKLSGLVTTQSVNPCMVWRKQMYGDQGPVMLLSLVKYRGVNYSVPAMHYKHDQTSLGEKLGRFVFLLFFID